MPPYSDACFNFLRYINLIIVVIPAKAGIYHISEIPACAGMILKYGMKLIPMHEGRNKSQIRIPQYPKRFRVWKIEEFEFVSGFDI